jgi:copper transport protein
MPFALGALRWTYLAALVVAVGGTIFAWRVPPRAADPGAIRRRAAGVASTAAWVVVACAVLRLAAQQWEAFASFSAADARVLLLETGWGRALIVQAVAAVALAATARRPAVAVPLAVVVAAAASFGGHPATFGAVSLVADTLHVLGASTWVGGLAVFAWAVLRDGDAARVRPALAAFSTTALAGASVSGLTGVVQAQRILGGFGALTTTRYGVTLMVKVAVLAAVAVLGARNWQQLTPRLGEPGGVARLRRSAWMELGVAAVALAVTAALVVTAPPGE